MDFRLSEEAQALKAEIAAVLEPTWHGPSPGYRAGDTARDVERERELRRRWGDHGWFGVGIPETYGGRGGGLEERYAVATTFGFYGAPYPKLAMNVVAPMILRYGTEAMKRWLLPQIAAGRLEFSQAFSESEAGSDLAALRTTATATPDGYRINGTKLYTSLIHRSDYCLVAARTGGRVGDRNGISLIVVDVAAVGIGVSPLWGMGDTRTNVVTWDDVVVPSDHLIGEAGHGWKYITTTLEFERLTAFGVSELRAFAAGARRWLEEHPDRRVAAVTLEQIEADIDALEALTYRALWAYDSGTAFGHEASMVKVAATELRQRAYASWLDCLGADAGLVDGDAPSAGEWMRLLEASIMPTFGGGANEIQRDIIASRALGLGRAADRGALERWMTA